MQVPYLFSYVDADGFRVGESGYRFCDPNCVSSLHSPVGILLSRKAYGASVGIFSYAADVDYFCPYPWSKIFANQPNPQPTPIGRDTVRTVLLTGVTVDRTVDDNGCPTFDDPYIPPAKGYVHIFDTRVITTPEESLPMTIRFEVDRPVIGPTPTPQPCKMPKVVNVKITVSHEETNPYVWLAREWNIPELSVSLDGSEWYAEVQWTNGILYTGPGNTGNQVFVNPWWGYDVRVEGEALSVEVGGCGECEYVSQPFVHCSRWEGICSTNINAERINQDLPTTSTWSPLQPGDTSGGEPVPQVVYGGSIAVTADNLRMTASVNFQDEGEIIGYNWIVQGEDGSNWNTGITTATLSLGELINPIPHITRFICNLTYRLPGSAQDRVAKLVKAVDVGTRTDHTMVIGWINPDRVSLETQDVRQQILTALPTTGIDMPDQCFSTAYALSNYCTGLPILLLQDPSTEEKYYILEWFFKFSQNQSDPSYTRPPESFRTNGIIDSTKISAFLATPENYKLAGQFQIRFRVDRSNPEMLKFRTGSVSILLDENYTGRTREPCFHTSVPAQIGPVDSQGGASVFGLTGHRLAVLGLDASPDAAGVRMFNTLMHKGYTEDPPVGIWENVGGAIRYWVPSDTGVGAVAEVATQDYPTYYIYVNGLHTGTRDQPLETDSVFYTIGTTYPFGNGFCPGYSCGGLPDRCGDGESSPSAGARQREYTRYLWWGLEE